MKAFKYIFLLSICLLILIGGCNDMPTSVGVTILPEQDFGAMHIDTFYATGHSSTYNLLNTNGIDRVMFGKYLSYEAWTCLKFYGWPDSLIGASVTGAEIQLRKVYHFGDSTSSLSFNVYRAHASLFGDSLTFDSLSSNGSYYYSGVPVNSTGNVLPNDTICTINIDTTMVREWFSTNYDTLNINDGLVICPNSSNVIKGFYTYYASDTAYQPVLCVNYIDTSGVAGTYIHKFSIARYVSTFNSSSLSTDLINVQNGISYNSTRGLISFDSLLITWPVLINKAVLELTLDSSKCSTHFLPYGTPFLNDQVYAMSTDANGISNGMVYSLSTKTTDSQGHYIYSFDLRKLAAYWLSNTFTRKVALSGYFENGSFDLFSFYGSGYNKSLKPRIIITYSLKK